MGAEQQVAHRAHGNSAGEGRVLHVHHVQFILVADKRGYNEGGHCKIPTGYGLGRWPKNSKKKALREAVAPIYGSQAWWMQRTDFEWPGLITWF